jgi:hypothetical protein
VKRPLALVAVLAIALPGCCGRNCLLRKQVREQQRTNQLLEEIDCAVRKPAPAWCPEAR